MLASSKMTSPSMNFSMPIDSMTDQEYIQAFRRNEQSVITAFYTQNKERFITHIGRKFHILDRDTLFDVYQDSIWRLWRIIQQGKLIEEKLTSSLVAYLQEGIGEKVMLETLRKQKESLASEEQLRLLEDELDDIDDVIAQEERIETIRQTISTMGKPCSPLLKLFYWEKLSWEVIATQLGYSNADTAKTQKYKCIQKLKTLFR